MIIYPWHQSNWDNLFEDAKRFPHGLILHGPCDSGINNFASMLAINYSVVILMVVEAIAETVKIVLGLILNPTQIYFLLTIALFRERSLLLI